jgi:thiol:disulfide interchange protein DsbA
MPSANHIFRAFARLVLGCAALMALLPAAHAQQGTPPRHIVLPTPQPSETPDKTEIIEFFAYSCIHCANTEPLVERWRPSVPSSAVFRPIPVAFNAVTTNLQKLYFTLESLNRLDLHPKVFIAIHQENKRLFTPRAIADWVVEQGVDSSQFEAAYNSFGVQAKANRANELARAYGINSTPTFAVAGKYLVMGGGQGSLDEVSRLLQ